MRLVKGLKAVVYDKNEVRVKQNIKIISDDGLSVKVQTIEVIEKMRSGESHKNTQKRAEEKLEREVEKFKNELRKSGCEVMG